MSNSYQLENKYTKGLGLYQSVIEFNDEFNDIYKEKMREIRSKYKIYKDMSDAVDRYVFSLSKADDIKDQIETNRIIYADHWISQEFNLKKAYRIQGFVKRSLKDPNYAPIPMEFAKCVPIQDLYDFEKARFTPTSMKACCPFPDHQDDSPSFTLNLKKNMFKCFGCGKFGDSIQFIQYLNGMSFLEATRYIFKNNCHA